MLAAEQRRAGVPAERARIARDLHDSLAQELAGSVLALQATERNWPDPGTARTRVREVADALFLSEATVKTHLVRIYRKLGAGNRAAAVSEAVRRGLLELG